MSPTALLICEGRCNPRIKQIDEFIARQGQNGFASYDGLRYQPHVHLFGDFWACEECGASRRWGHFGDAGEDTVAHGGPVDETI